MKKIITFLCVSCMLISCHFNTIRKNSPEDIADAQKIAEKFYFNIMNQSFEEATDMFSEQALKEKSRDSSISFLKQVQFHLGDIASYEYSKGSSYVRAGTNPKGEYELEYKVVYEKAEVVERFGLMREKGIIKIFGYKVHSDLLKEKMPAEVE